MKPIIEIHGLSKSYKITGVTDYYFTLRDTLMNLARAPNRFLRGRGLKLVNRNQELFWALQNVDLTIDRGEIIGIIGSNGAGKSTLLKILSRITDPTSGEAIIRGKISSLLEVGTGFHPELTGRENIFFSGAILGMRRREIVKKFDSIVGFAELEKFLDTPVKRYSSGMHVRLGFSVAVHMEPDILLIDEALAVGDANFQKKCLNKIHEVSRRDERTILFVSHNLDAVQNICDRAVYLEKGRVKMIGQTNEVVQSYLGCQVSLEQRPEWNFPETSQKPFQINRVAVKNSANLLATNFSVGEPFSVEVYYGVRKNQTRFWVTVQCVSEYGSTVFFSRDTDGNPHLLAERERGNFISVFRFPANLSFSLNQGRYSLIVRIEQDPSIEVTIPVFFDDPLKKFPHHPGVVLIGEPWQNSPLSL